MDSQPSATAPLLGQQQTPQPYSSHPIQPFPQQPPQPISPTSLGSPDVRFVSSMEFNDPAIVTIDHDDLYENTHFLMENKLNLFFTIIVLGLLVCLVLFSPWVDILQQGSTNIGLIICGALSGIFLIAYMIESFCSGTRQYLSDITDPVGIQNHIHRVRSNSPHLRFHVECYHYETITTTSRDSNGNTTTSTRQEKRVTHRESQPFLYDCWDDISGELIGVGAIYRLTRVRFHKKFVFADAQTCQSWENEARAFQDRNRYRDVHMNFWHTLDIPDYIPRMLAIMGAKEDVPKCLGLSYFILWTIILCGYCYRSWFHSISTKQSYEYVKRIQRLHRHYY